MRIAAENQDFVTLCPYAPRYPFETWILPRRHESAFENSPSSLYENLARMLQTVLNKAIRVLDDPAYNLVLHTSPIQENTNDYYHWHLEIIPKLTKIAGFEWGTGFYITPRHRKRRQGSCAKQSWKKRSLPKRNPSLDELRPATGVNRLA